MGVTLCASMSTGMCMICVYTTCECVCVCVCSLSLSIDFTLALKPRALTVEIFPPFFLFFSLAGGIHNDQTGTCRTQWSRITRRILVQRVSFLFLFFFFLFSRRLGRGARNGDLLLAVLGAVGRVVSLSFTLSFTSTLVASRTSH